VEPQRVEIREISEPKVGPKDVLLKVRAAGICGSDLHLYRGQHAFRKLPAILGHEVAGEVISVGSEVKQVKPGMAVTVLPLTEPLAVAVHVVRRLEVERGQTMAILGSGTIGLLVLSVAKHLGVGTIVATDALDYNLDIAKKLGATATVNVLKDDLEKVVNELTDGWGVRSTVIAAGAPNIIDQATAITARRGRICLVGMISKPILVQTYNFVAKEITLLGSQTYTADDFKVALDLLSQRAIDTELLITKTVPFAATAEAMDIVDQRKENVIKVIVQM
jgi:L-iditol 2-dehydrogenase